MANSGETLRGLLRDTRGATILEYAVLAPMVLALLIAVLQIAFVYIAQGMLETTAEGAARLILTGQAQTYSGTASDGTTYTGMTQSDFKSAACTILKAQSPFMTCDKLYVDVTTVSSYADATTALPTLTFSSSGAVSNSFSYTVGSQGSIVVLRVMYLLPLAGAPMGFSLTNQSNKQRLLLATSVFKTEAYTS